MKPDTTTLRLIKLKYTGEELEAYLIAWEIFPTLKTDCPNERRIKEKLRETRAARILKKEVNL